MSAVKGNLLLLEGVSASVRLYWLEKISQHEAVSVSLNFNALALVLASGTEMQVSLSSPEQESHLNTLFDHSMDCSGKPPR